MRKLFVPCETCPDDPRYQNEARWVVFGSVAICNRCRLNTIDTMRLLGFRLVDSHPFTDELSQVDRGMVIHNFDYDS